MPYIIKTLYNPSCVSTTKALRTIYTNSIYQQQKYCGHKGNTTTIKENYNDCKALNACRSPAPSDTSASVTPQVTYRVISDSRAKCSAATTPVQRGQRLCDLCPNAQCARKESGMSVSKTAISRSAASARRHGAPGNNTVAHNVSPYPASAPSGTITTWLTGSWIIRAKFQ